MANEWRLSDLLSEFARTLVTNFPIQAILDHLVVRIAEMLPIDTLPRLHPLVNAVMGQATPPANVWSRPPGVSEFSSAEPASVDSGDSSPLSSWLRPRR